MARSSAGVFPQTSKLWCCRGCLLVVRMSLPPFPLVSCFWVFHMCVVCRGDVCSSWGVGMQPLSDSCGHHGEGLALLAPTSVDSSTPHGGHQCCCMVELPTSGIFMGFLAHPEIPARRGARSGGMPEARLCSAVVLGAARPQDAITFQGPPAPQLTGAVCACITRLFWIIQPCFSNTWSSGSINVGILIGIHNIPSVLGLYCKMQIKPKLLEYISSRF